MKVKQGLLFNSVI